MSVYNDITDGPVIVGASFTGNTYNVYSNSKSFIRHEGKRELYEMICITIVPTYD
jgi:hypothetical protein